MYYAEHVIRIMVELNLILFMLTQLYIPKKGQVYLYLAIAKGAPLPEGSWSPDCSAPRHVTVGCLYPSHSGRLKRPYKAGEP